MYPYTSRPPGGYAPIEVIVFIVGGTTYEESKIVAQFNQEQPSVRVLLGGTNIHNFKSFTREVRHICNLD
eukprot:m.596512 g.596512  ORF g.596512 m.596512 type:complete len:70 (-) comp58051_c0_seq7:132-341(-)